VVAGIVLSVEASKMSRLTTVMLTLLAAVSVAASPEPGTPLGRELVSISGESLNLAQALSQATELAISPLLTLTALSAWRWFQTDPGARDALSFYAQPWFWGPALLLLALIFFKEAFIARIPGAKKPLDALQLVENKVSGLVASPLAIGALAGALHRTMQGVSVQQITGLFIGTAHAAGDTGSSAGLPEWLSWTFALVGAITVYGSVWMASHTINVLILLSPFGLVDNALKLLRVGLLIFVALLTRYLPMVGSVVCGLLVLAAILLAGFSWRLLRFGWSFSTGLLRRPADVAREGRVFAFSGSGLGLPVRTSGWLSLEEGVVVFRYRRGFVLPRTVRLTSRLRVERGLLHPVVLDDRGRLAFRLTPRVRGEEEQVAKVLGGLEVEDLAVVRGLQGVVAWIEGALTGEVTTQLDA
jgi:hypothetical protein